MKSQVVIVGAGLAGLCCARRLSADGVDVQLLEGSDAVGGRVRTDLVDGFRIDRGFQVFLTAYPEARAVLDYDALDLQAFDSGSLIQRDGKRRLLADPWRNPGALIPSALSSDASLFDKLRVARLRGDSRRRSLDDVFAMPERSTLEELRELGFGERIIERFFRPFLGGIFLEPDLATSNRMFAFVFKMFAEGHATVPADGMQRIPEQIAAGLPDGVLRLNTRVSAAAAGQVTLESGESLEADAVVIATDATDAAALLPGGSAPAWCATDTISYDAPEPPYPDNLLLLNGEGRGPVNNVAVMSNVSAAYAPAGRALVTISVVRPQGPKEPIERGVREQLTDWFGAAVSDWRMLRHDRIERALPAQPPGVLEPPQRPVTRDDGLFVCGDARDNASIQGAMVSGRRAAEAILAR